MDSFLPDKVKFKLHQYEIDILLIFERRIGRKTGELIKKTFINGETCINFKIKGSWISRVYARLKFSSASSSVCGKLTTSLPNG